ncbi:MAG TPA: methyltransferase domain-containing protein [Patescibacteria group bacterium]|nr:methyltransferase domain-containing protein [Patescibacteria group bacterium]
MIGTKVLEERESKHNGHIKVSRSLGMGTYIQAEGLTQSGGVVGVIWKPTIKKIKSMGIDINTCLILGMGGGTAAKYVRLFWPKVKITGVDIDPVMIDLGKKYLGLSEIGVKIVIGDAYNFDPKGYDLVIVDIYKGEEFPEKFATENFLSKFGKNKLVVFNRTYYGEKRPEAVRFGKILEKNFKNVEYFYPEANVMFLCSN